MDGPASGGYLMTSVTTRRLSELLRDIVAMPVSEDREVQGVSQDSRRMQPGDLFLALPGMRSDGRGYIDEAIARGASAVICEAGGEAPIGGTVPVYAVDNLRDCVGKIASRFYGAPSRKLIVVGVTGTNGKTTCTQLLAQALDASSKRCAVIGTLGYGFPGHLDASLHTTPDAVTVQKLMAQFSAQRATHVSMEVSSHALAQGRVNGVAFDVAVFTNLTREHLDYHGDMANYGASKTGLFEMPGLKYAVINRDDAFGRGLLDRLTGRVATLSYGLEGGEVYATKIDLTHDGLVMQVATPAGDIELRSPLFGRFNAANLLAVLATLLVLGVDLPTAAQNLSRARPAAGRVERFGGRSGLPLVVVDYAHTPDALEQVLQALRSHAAGRLWCVFGCGGDRDRGKRPEMGRIAERLADTVVLTDDNPRHEDPEQIITDIRAGMHTVPLVNRDRRTAIAQAVTEAGAEDIVLVAGKGHEDYQQIGDQRLAYSDRDTVRALLEAAA